MVEDSRDRIHLKITKARKALFFFARYIIPVYLICMIPVVITFSGIISFAGGIPIYLTVLMVAAALTVALVLFFSKVIHEVIITGSYVEIDGRRGLGKTKDIIDLAEVNHIYVKVMYGRGGGTFFGLHRHNGEKTQFITIPLLFMTRKNSRLICARLRKLTKLRLEGNYLAGNVLGEPDPSLN